MSRCIYRPKKDKRLKRLILACEKLSIVGAFFCSLLYRGKLYESRKLRQGGDRKSKEQNVLLINTAEVIGKEYGLLMKINLPK